MTSGQNVVDGRFELVGRLGSGGMGTVWRALDLTLQREVALKEVRPGGGEEVPDEPALAAMYRERVLREARALARIDHPNVVTIHHIVDAPGMPFPWLVMELVRGESLQDRLSRGTMEPAEAARTGRGILAALRASHAAGICHRDIKPANVLMREDGSPVLTDFGIAVLDEASRVTATGGLVGSPEYIAPERLHGHEGDPSSDLWSLGMLLYVAVEGQNPVRRATLAATLAAVMTAQIPRPQRAGALTDVIGALLVADPAFRPNAEQLDGLLARAADSAAGPLTPPPAQYTGGDPGTPGHFQSPPPGGMPPVTPQPYPGAGTFAGNLHAPPPGAAQYPYSAHPQTMPGGHPQGSPYGPGGQPAPTVLSSPEPRRARRPRRSLTNLVSTAVALCVGLGGLAVAANSLLPVLNGTTDGPTVNLPEISLPGSDDASESEGSTGEGAQTGSFLTPAGMRKVIAAFKRYTGEKKFATMTVYPTYAIVGVPVNGRDATDTYMYRNGTVTKTGAGGGPDGIVDFDVFAWDELPRLLKTAEKDLKIPDPTARYLIIDGAWTFNDDKPTIRVYLADDYGGNYLAANTKGKIVFRSTD
ncbi:serine/threonine protein kinase [Actinocorallia herbida]|uniref:non-specific serine/threonine protein kinase n=1 Tax=Actinocorallia herbida TaxID=58109 RepID=A0A3N1CV41_9ACTN|nr:serine/threonine-protein kinase [Actinocorallia herbida]ROO85156.1 serine/threonine protein kinase [Actinocorallia herbida]